MDKTYLPFHQLKVGDKFRDPQTGTLCMKVACMQGDTVETLVPRTASIATSSIMQRQNLNAVSLAPYVYKGVSLPAGDLGYVEDLWAVELVLDDQVDPDICMKFSLPYGIEIEANNGGARLCASDLAATLAGADAEPGSDQFVAGAVEGIERLLVALAAAGADLSTMSEAVGTAVEAFGNDLEERHKDSSARAQGSDVHVTEIAQVFVEWYVWGDDADKVKALDTASHEHIRSYLLQGYREGELNVMLPNGDDGEVRGFWRRKP
jgi:hypothetical protein